MALRNAKKVRSSGSLPVDLKGYAIRLRKKRTPLVLTVDGRPELVVQDAESYQELMDRLEHAETVAAVREGMEQAARGETMTLEEAERRLRKKYGFSR